MSDFVIKQGDTEPVLNDTLTYSSGAAANLTGAAVLFVMRPMTALAPTTALAATIVSPTAGTVSYTFTSTDSAVAGQYAAEWQVTFSGGALQRWPTDGYLEISVEENLSTAGGSRIVGLGEVKDYLGIQTTDRTRDAKLMRFIDACTPVVESITGPIVQHVYQNEIHDGGGKAELSLRHRPVLSVAAVSEFRGPINYPLTQIATPDLGTIYSYMWEPNGRITRRTVGGGSTPFPGGPETVWVSYSAGYIQPPHNVVQGTLELIRESYQDTQQGRPQGLGGTTSTDLIPTLLPTADLISPKVRSWLMPNKRHPRIA